MKPVIYVVVNNSLEMSPGKLAAQVGHAVVGSIGCSSHENLGAWQNEPHRWMIILNGENATHLTSIREYLLDRGVKSYAVIDEGVNEVLPFSITALGVEVLDKASDNAALLGGLKQYKAPSTKIKDYTIPDCFLNRRGRKRKEEILKHIMTHS